MGRITALIEAAGNDVRSSGELESGVEWHEAVAKKIATMDCMIVVWSRHSIGDRQVMDEAQAALGRRTLIPVLLDKVSPPPGFNKIQSVDLSDWGGSPEAPEIADLLRALERCNPMHRRSVASPNPMAMPPPAPGRATSSAGSRPQGIFSKVTGAIGAAVERLRSHGQRAKPRTKSSDEPRPRLANGASPAPKSAEIDVDASEPVLLGVAAPRQTMPGTNFSARFVAYVAAAKQLAETHLRDLSDDGDRIVTDIAPDRAARWRVGAPITVYLTGEHVRIAPAERRFEWNGRENLLSFGVTVDADAPRGKLQLCFHILLDGLEIAFIPVGVAVDARSADRVMDQVTVCAPSSAFASYSSQDAESVARSLSTLAHWAPTLDIFQDCLDLTPNEAFKPQLEAQIGKRDVFLLFWSRHARDSKWVWWEFETARAKRGMAAILPVPLEDPAIAPPPPGFEEKHLRDRFMIAGYGLKKIAEMRDRQK